LSRTEDFLVLIEHAIEEWNSLDDPAPEGNSMGTEGEDLESTWPTLENAVFFLLTTGTDGFVEMWSSSPVPTEQRVWYFGRASNQEVL
jgi:hypothetical protein